MRFRRDRDSMASRCFPRCTSGQELGDVRNARCELPRPEEGIATENGRNRPCGNTVRLIAKVRFSSDQQRREESFQSPRRLMERILLVSMSKMNRKSLALLIVLLIAALAPASA